MALPFVAQYQQQNKKTELDLIGRLIGKILQLEKNHEKYPPAFEKKLDRLNYLLDELLIQKDDIIAITLSSHAQYLLMENLRGMFEFEISTNK
jgi:hypothetical protein